MKLKLEFGDEVEDYLKGDELFTVITFKTPYGPTETMARFVELIEGLGWKVEFKANWWTADIPYGIIRIDAFRDGREKIILGKWLLGRECTLLGIENMPLEKGKEEFYKMIDSITSTLIHDPAIRTMREQY